MVYHVFGLPSYISFNAYVTPLLQSSCFRAVNCVVVISCEHKLDFLIVIIIIIIVIIIITSWSVPV